MFEMQVNFRPWANLPADRDLAHALKISKFRRIFFYLGEPVWYLGERVVRQHSINAPLVPMDPPATMMGRSLLRVCESGAQNFDEVISWDNLVYPNFDYKEFVRGRLASVVVVQEGEVSFLILLCSCMFIHLNRSPQYSLFLPL